MSLGLIVLRQLPVVQQEAQEETHGKGFTESNEKADIRLSREIKKREVRLRRARRRNKKYSPSLQATHVKVCLLLTRMVAPMLSAPAYGLPSLLFKLGGPGLP